jgi:hypothetical protein
MILRVALFSTLMIFGLVSQYNYKNIEYDKSFLDNFASNPIQVSISFQFNSPKKKVVIPLLYDKRIYSDHYNLGIAVNSEDHNVELKSLIVIEKTKKNLLTFEVKRRVALDRGDTDSYYTSKLDLTGSESDSIEIYLEFLEYSTGKIFTVSQRFKIKWRKELGNYFLDSVGSV